MAIIINGNNTPTAGGVGYGNGTELAFTPSGSVGNFLVSAGSGAPAWTSAGSVAVTSLSFGTTGLTPATSSTGAITVAGVLNASNGGTGLSALGTGVASALGTNVGALGAFVVNGGALGTPSSGTLTNCSGLPVSTGISGLASGIAAWLATPSSANLAAAVTDETGTGSLVFATSPSLTTPSLGAATATSINKITITAPAVGATLTLADGKTLTANNTLTFNGTDGSSVDFGAGGTVAYTSNNLGVFATTTSAQLAGVISDETGSGSLVFGTSPSLTTPDIGIATATSVNKLTITAPATSATLTIADGKTFSVNNSVTFSGTDGTTFTLPSITDILAGLGSNNIFTVPQTFRAANSVRVEAAATQDAIVLAGRAGGTGGFAATLTPPTLAANVTITLPTATGALASLANVPQTFAGATTFNNAISFLNNVTFGNATSDLINAGGTARASLSNGSKWQTTTVAGNNFHLAAYDTDGAAYADLVTLTAGTAPALNLNSVAALTFQIAGSEKMRLDTSGNLLLGSTNAIAKLQVEAGVLFVGDSTYTGANSSSVPNNYHLLFDNTYNVIPGAGIPANKIRLFSSPSNIFGFGLETSALTYHSYESHTFYTSTEPGYYGTEIAKISAAGNFGVGVSLPSARLHAALASSVTTPVSMDSTLLLENPDGTPGNGAALGFRSSTGERARIVGVFPVDTSGELSFQTTTGSVTSERMRIDQNGRVGFGTNTPSAAITISGTNQFTFAGTASCTGNVLDVTSVGSGTLNIGDRIFGPGFEYNTYVTALGTGLGGVGTYIVNNAQSVPSTNQMGAYAAAKNTLQIVDTDTSTSAGQPVGAVEWFCNDASVPGAGVKGYVAVLNESSAPNTAMIFGTAPNTADVQAFERMRISSNGVVTIGNGFQAFVPVGGTLSGTGGSGTDVAGASLTIRGGPGTGAGAGGPVIFSTAAAGASGTTLRTATERMRITSTGNVGIGTTSPSTLLDLGQTFFDGTPATLAEAINKIALYQNAGTPQYGIGLSQDFMNVVAGEGSGGMRFYTGGLNERLSITATGQIGIATSTPTGNATRFAHIHGTTSELHLTSTAAGAAATDGLSVMMWSDSVAYFIQRENAAMVFSTNNTERIRITSTGDVGIGTNSPSAKLNVTGTLGAVQVASTGNRIAYTRNGANYIGTSGAAASLNYEAETHSFYNGAGTTERLRIDSSGNCLIVSSGGLGYGTGSGGAVTQATSRTTGVTLNKTNGAITLVSAAGTTAWQSFTVTNSTVAATDTVIVSQKSGTDLYMTHVTAVAAGSFRITFATTCGTTTEQPVFNFAVIKAATA